ncbi:hypothetical protein DdX_13880 [Ditylenchus destructor]|uniref:Uncharacterized protein n=1 Tax=Ditylenchus destructor TaxID=166010 RepID=A0AAD4MT22_9BILA|nr:hypothetical protein DdX_13880 [Ditylenchus destructor]
MASFRKTFVIFLLFLSEFAATQNLVFDYFKTFHATSIAACLACVNDCFRVYYDEIADFCYGTPVDVFTCLCNAAQKVIKCVEPCPECQAKYSTLRRMKEYIYNVHCQPPSHKLY